VQSRHSPISHNFPMDANRTFPFQKTNYKGDTEFWVMSRATAFRNYPARTFIR
jgi:hypothetical protein